MTSSVLGTTLLLQRHLLRSQGRLPAHLVESFVHSAEHLLPKQSEALRLEMGATDEALFVRAALSSAMFMSELEQAETQRYCAEARTDVEVGRREYRAEHFLGFLSGNQDRVFFAAPVIAVADGHRVPSRDDWSAEHLGRTTTHFREDSLEPPLLAGPVIVREGQGLLIAGPLLIDVRPAGPWANWTPTNQQLPMARGFRFHVGTTNDLLQILQDERLSISGSALELSPTLEFASRLATGIEREDPGLA